MKNAVLALAFLPNLVFAGPITFTVDISARDSSPYTLSNPSPIAGQVKFTFDKTRRRVVTSDSQFSYNVEYIDQAPFISPLSMPDDTVYTVGARAFRITDSGPVNVLVYASGSAFNVDENGYFSQQSIYLGKQIYLPDLVPLSANDILQYFQNSEKLTFQASSFTYTNFPQPASNFTWKYYYSDTNPKLVSVSSEAEISEPATLASLVLGLGLIGFTRKNRKAAFTGSSRPASLN